MRVQVPGYYFARADKSPMAENIGASLTPTVACDNYRLRNT